LTSHRVGVVIDISRVAGGAGSETQVPKLLPDEKRGDAHQHNQDDHAARELVSAVLASRVFLSRFQKHVVFLVSRAVCLSSSRVRLHPRCLLIRVVVVVVVVVVVFLFPRTSLSINSLKYTPKKAISTQMVYHVLAAMYCLAEWAKLRKSVSRSAPSTHASFQTDERNAIESSQNAFLRRFPSVHRPSSSLFRVVFLLVVVFLVVVEFEFQSKGVLSL
jgi:hypothetical protein